MLLLELVADKAEEPSLDDLEEALHSSRGSLDETERMVEENKVQIMTMHAAKGLTADAVIVAACDDHLIPGETESGRELADQRRLLYVSLTRARHFLYVTFARRRYGRQSHLLQVVLCKRLEMKDCSSEPLQTSEYVAPEPCLAPTGAS